VADQALVQHGGTLTLQFILVGRQVAVGPDDDWSCPLDQGDVVAGACPWEVMGLVEDGEELGEQSL
jgi:hypothetical protein